MIGDYLYQFAQFLHQFAQYLESVSQTILLQIVGGVCVVVLLFAVIRRICLLERKVRYSGKNIYSFIRELRRRFSCFAIIPPIIFILSLFLFPYFYKCAQYSFRGFILLYFCFFVSSALLLLGWRYGRKVLHTEVEGEFKTFWEYSFVLFTWMGILLFGLTFVYISKESCFASIQQILPLVGKGMFEFGKDWALPVIVGIVAWLTYIANRESIDRPYFSVFFTDDSLYNHKSVEKEELNSRKRPESEYENENKIVEVVPWFVGKHPINFAENEEFTVSICIKNTQPPGALFHRGAPGSRVSVFFYMPPNIVPFRAYRRDSVTEERQVLEACEYGLFKDRSYIAVPVAYNVSPPSITMLSKEEAVVVEITSRIEKPLDGDFYERLQSIGVQITSNEGITADVKWLYLKFEKMEENEKTSEEKESEKTSSNCCWNFARKSFVFVMKKIKGEEYDSPKSEKEEYGSPNAVVCKSTNKDCKGEIEPWEDACKRLFDSLTEKNFEREKGNFVTRSFDLFVDKFFELPSYCVPENDKEQQMGELKRRFGSFNEDFEKAFSDEHCKKEEWKNYTEDSFNSFLDRYFGTISTTDSASKEVRKNCIEDLFNLFLARCFETISTIDSVNKEEWKNSVKYLFGLFLDRYFGTISATDSVNKEEWKNSVKCLFGSFLDNLLEMIFPDDFVRDGIEWKLAVTRLLGANSKDNVFKKLAYQLQKDYSTTPGHKEPSRKDDDSITWTEIPNVNNNYEVLSKLLSAIWYLMGKELVPPSPNFQKYPSQYKSDTVLLTSSRDCVPLLNKRNQNLNSRDADYLDEFRSDMKKYLRYQAFGKQGKDELILAFYENCLKNKFYSKYKKYKSNLKNYKDWETFNAKTEKKFPEGFRERIDKYGKAENNTKVPYIKDFLKDFVFVHYYKLLELCHSKPGGRSTPQRVFPLATVLPKDGTVGVLELGCHRGDVGLALLNLDFVLSEPKSYFTSSFRDFIGDPKSLRWVCDPIQKYFGVTDTLVSDDDWILAQWGTHTKMRRKLQRFHYDFKSGNNERFRKIKADLCDVNSYVSEAIDFLKGMDNLVVLTSYALCFIPFDKRRRLAQAIRTIQSYYETANPNGKFFWYNQGRSVDEIFDKDSSHEVATRFYLGEMCFKGAFLFGIDLLQIANDLHTKWRNPQFSLLCQERNKEECERFVNTVEKSSSDFKRYAPSPWRDDSGIYCCDSGTYDDLVNGGPKKAQETSIYANIVFPMLENVGKEAGAIQRRLESQKMCFVGSDADAVQTMADIEKCRSIWRDAGISTLDWVVCDSDKETARLFQSLPDRLRLAYDSIRIVPAFSGIDRKRWERRCSDYPTFDAVVKNGLAQYEKLIIEPRRSFGLDENREYVFYAPIMENGMKAIALPVYMDQDFIGEKGKFHYEKFFSEKDCKRLKIINMVKRLALDAYRAVGCQDFGVVEIIYSERFGLQVSRIQPLPYFWKYTEINKDDENKSTKDVEPKDVVEFESNDKGNAKEKRFCEAFGLPKVALKNGFFYAWDKMYGSRGGSNASVDALLSVLCNMAQRDVADRRRFMHVLWYDKEEGKTNSKTP